MTNEDLIKAIEHIESDATVFHTYRKELAVIKEYIQIERIRLQDAFADGIHRGHKDMEAMMDAHYDKVKLHYEQKLSQAKREAVKEALPNRRETPHYVHQSIKAEDAGYNMCIDDIKEKAGL